MLHPKDCLEMTLLANGILLIITVFVSWFVIFRVLGIGDFEELPLDEGTIDFFLETPVQQIYKEVADGLKEAMKKNAGTRANKARMLKRGHSLIILTWILLFSFTILFLFYKGRASEVDLKKTGSVKQELTIASQRDRSISLDIPDRWIYLLGAVCRQTTSKTKEPHHG